MSNRVAVVVLAVGAAFALITNAASAEPFVFACKVHGAPGLVDPSHGQVVDLPVLVSPESGTVNRLPAAITDGLVTWVDNSGGPSNTLSFALDRKRLVLGVYDDTGRELMVGTCIAPGQLAAPAPPPPPAQPQPQAFTLACRLEIVGSLESGHTVATEPSFAVDPIAGTVNGAPASITDARIQWAGGGKHSPSTTIINRFTGGIGVLGSDGRLLLTGTCVLATTRQF